MPGWKNRPYTWIIGHSSHMRSAVQKKRGQAEMK